MSLPIVCSYEDGCSLVFVQVEPHFTMDQVAAAAAGHYLGRWLPERKGSVLRVRTQKDAAVVPRNTTVQDAGWVPLETIEIIYEA